MHEGWISALEFLSWKLIYTAFDSNREKVKVDAKKKWEKFFFRDQGFTPSLKKSPSETRPFVYSFFNTVKSKFL